MVGDLRGSADMRVFQGAAAGRVRTAAVVGAALVALVGCGNDDGGAATTTSAAAATSTSAKASTTSASGASGASEASGASGNAATSPTSASAATGAPSLAPGWNAKVFEHAGRTALAAVPGSSLVSIEENSDGSWVVDLINADGVAVEVGISPDGDRVIAGPSVTGDPTPGTDVAKLDYTAATGVVLTEVPGGRITDLQLVVEKGGTYVWEADVVDASGARRAVDVDAVSGRVLQNAPR
ncbi:metallopeptidase [Rhodococcus hoagii]|uniref:Metallopeptidase n=2 Tax=Rhodococcus hoagii TaxID=43767 RepID=A0A9Q5EYE7_RHOHA|nr:metallopeptidase [Prescottella equi]MBM4491965.1 metallopeptidase [Prescottella equi]MBM4497832.1 metallopeptidase [Prescottella equi]MBM4506759.1 metallopeptidase [Prescottella equi]MBM4513748.1 metallopeptidase [Prescottella equi]